MALVNIVEGLSPYSLLHCFISGPKKELQQDVISYQEDSITKAFNLARLFEKKHGPVEKNIKIKNSYTHNISIALRKTPQLTYPVPQTLGLPAPSIPTIKSPSP